MRRKLPWPFFLIIFSSFLVGAVWGWKIIRDRASAEDRLEAESKLRILAPADIFPRELLLEFQRREKIEVELSTEAFPASLLRRALKSAPGQFDAVLLYHHQVSALRAERKLAGLYDTRVKFPTNIAPDFRKLPNDRNLMDTAPLLWGLIGEATKKEFEGTKSRYAFWPSFLIGTEDISVTPVAYAAKIQSLFKPQPASTPLASGLYQSHGALAFPPLSTAGLTFTAIQTAERESYALWILTLAGLADGDIERTRKFVRFLLEPAQNVALINGARIGGTTLRETEGLEGLPPTLQASYFRKFSLEKILIERDERVRATDEILEQVVLGANLKVAPTETPKPPAPKARVKAAPAVVEEAEPEPEPAVTVPSEPQPHDD